MRILQICSKPPFPPTDGGSMAMHAITEGLKQAGAVVDILTIATHKHPFQKNKIPADYFKNSTVDVVEIDTRIKPFAAFLNLFTTKSYNIERFCSEQLNAKVASLLKAEKYDIIHIETLWATTCIDTIRKYSKAKIVYRAHNIEYTIWEQKSKQEKNVFKKWYLNLLAGRLKKYELSILQNVDAIVTITPEDAKICNDLGIKNKIHVAPFGINTKTIPNIESNKSNTDLFFLGAMNWSPNAEGVKWFLEKNWPELKSAFPDLNFSIAGRFMPDWIKKYSGNGVNIVGEVPNQYEYIANNGIMVVPLLSGGGMRIKMVEAMIMGKCIVSTSIGAEGIAIEKNKNMLIANNADEFMNAIKMLVNDKNKVAEIGNNAKTFALKEFNNSIICHNLFKFYQSLLA